MPDCKWYDIFCHVVSAIKVAVNGVLDVISQAVLGAITDSIASMSTMWINIGTPDLTHSSGSSTITPGDADAASGNVTTVLGYVTWISLTVTVLSLLSLGALVALKRRAGEGLPAMGKLGLILGAVVLISGASALVAGLMPTGPHNTGGAAQFLQSGLWWYMGATATLSVILGGVKMVWEQRAEPGRETVKSLFILVVVAGAGVTIVGLLITASDSFSSWLLDRSLACGPHANSACFKDKMREVLGLDGLSGVGAVLGIILGLILLLTTLVQIILMIARSGMLVILAGILPLSASFTNTEMGKNWFRKCIGWLTAFLLYKPAAAIVYATAFQLVGTQAINRGDGLLNTFCGLMLMMIAVFALPVLMRFVTPMVGTIAGGSGGGGTAALAALPTGVSSISRLASGSSTGSNPSSSGPSGSPSIPGGGGAGTRKAGSHSSTGAVKSSIGAPASASGAAGAAGGPAGIGMEAAKKAGQTAVKTVSSVGEQATGERSDPDGSR